MKALAFTLATLSLVSVLPPGAKASDFSELANPSFARSMMIDAERNKESFCAALAYLPYRELEIFDVQDEPIEPLDAPPTLKAAPDAEPIPEDEFEKLLTKEQAVTLRDAVLLRLASDIGNANMAYVLFESRAMILAPEAWNEAEDFEHKATTRERFKADCAPIYAAVANGSLEKALSPASAAPIALPDVTTCLAYDLIARNSPEYETMGFGNFHRDGLYKKLVGPKGTKRRLREKEIAARAASLPDVQPEVAARRLMPCIAVFATEL